MKNRKLFIVLGLVGIMGISVFAKPLYQEVMVLLNTDIKYTLDEQEVLKGKGALVFADKVYLPIRDAANVLDVDIDYKDKKVILTTKKEVVNPKKETIPYESEEIVYPVYGKENVRESFKGKIEEIDLKNNIVLIEVESKDNYGGILMNLKVNDKTTIYSRNMNSTNLNSGKCSINDLKTGMVVNGVKEEKNIHYNIPESLLYELVFVIEDNKSTPKERDIAIDDPNLEFTKKQENTQKIIDKGTIERFSDN